MAGKVRIRIESAYPGEKFLEEGPYSDVAISDVRLIPEKIQPR